MLLLSEEEEQVTKKKKKKKTEKEKKITLFRFIFFQLSFEFSFSFSPVLRVVHSPLFFPNQSIMRGITLVRGFAGRGLPHRGRGRNVRSNASSSSSSSASPSSTTTTKLDPLLKAALTSGGLSLAGDLLAQGLTHRLKKEKQPKKEEPAKGLLGGLFGAGKKKQPPPSPEQPFSLDLARAARMGLFGLLFYGPYQHWWYGLLDRSFPGRSTPAFASKVALNQLALAPVVLAVVFAWNLVPLGRGREWPAKVKNDLWPTMVNGWKFWVPAASVNFYAVPLEGQVAYMSACGLLWTAYLSYSSN